MTWQMFFPNQTIRRLDILAGKPPLLAVWTRSDQVRYYDLRDGVAQGETRLMPPTTTDRESETWQAFVATLKSPNNTALPIVRSGDTTLYSSTDGRMRLYHTGNADVYLEEEGQEAKLDAGGASNFVALAFDPQLGVSAALDENARLHIYQQNIPIGAFNTGLTLTPELQPALAIAHSGSSIFASDGQRLVLMDNGGKILKTLDTHYYVGQMACSPNGNRLAASDLESGVIRVYSGSELIPMHQRFAADLLERAQMENGQVLSSPDGAALSALAINNQGAVAFAQSGHVCVSETGYMDAMPRPQRLL
ncbi:MAG: hypothetical protein U0694_03285 [Anaerolineae bacterium]